MRPLIVSLALVAALAPARAEPPDADNLYHYRAVITEVYDGDTVTADVDLGFSVWVRGERLRLARIDAPEIRGADKEAGFAARDFLRDLILDKPLIVETIQDQMGKHGRALTPCQALHPIGKCWPDWPPANSGLARPPNPRRLI